MNKIRWIIFIIVTLGILTTLVILSNGSKIDVSSIDDKAIQVASKQNGGIADHVSGRSDSKVTFIEYGDFQCPPCASMSPIIKQISEQYKDSVRFVFRNFPITTAHPNAKAAAGSAEAAGLQGKFWEMHDKIYATQDSWSNLDIDKRNKFFEGLALELNLDKDKFNNDVKKPSVTSKINFDYALGKKAGVEGTPSFFLNGSKVDSKVFGDPDKLKEAINLELKKFKINVPK